MKKVFLLCVLGGKTFSPGMRELQGLTHPDDIPRLQNSSAEIHILEIQKEILTEATKGLKELPPHEQSASTHPINSIPLR